MNGIIILLFVFLLLCLWHYIYEFLIKPTSLTYIRYKLFSVRDDLRYLKWQYGEKLADPLYDQIQSMINNGFHLIEFMTFSKLARFHHELRNNKRLKQMLEAAEKKLDKQLDKCTIPELKNIMDEVKKISWYALILHSGAYIVYIFPTVFIYYLIRSYMKYLAESFISVPEHTRNKAIPSLAY